VQTGDAIKLLDPQFGYLAKSDGEHLYAHQFTVWAIAKRLIRYIPSLRNNPEEGELIEWACLTHDIGKMDPKVQDKLLHHPTRRVKHRVEHVWEIEHYLEAARQSGWSGPMPDLNRLHALRDVITTHHGVLQHDLVEIKTPSAGFFTDVLMAADHLGSMARLSHRTVGRLKRLFHGLCDFASIEFSRFPSPTSYVVLQTAAAAFKEKGWEILVALEDSLLLVAKPGTHLPEKRAPVSLAFQDVIRNIITLQRSVPVSFTNDFLSPFAKQYPALFLEVHRDKLMEALNNTDQKACVFLKLCHDILAGHDLIDEEAREQCRLLAMTDSANSTSAHGKAKERFEKEYGCSAPNKVNNDFFHPLFEKDKLVDIVPSRFLDHEHSKQRLASMRAKELYVVLEKLAKSGPSTSSSELETYLDRCLCVEETTDFRGMAQEIFRQYCEYKRTSDALKGACERCGCPASKPASPALNTSQAWQAFSQIKPKYAYRAICALCAFDNLYLREGVGGEWIRVFLRIESRVPELMANWEKLDRLITLIERGAGNVREIVRLEDKPSLAGLPFPNRLEVPVGDEANLDPTALAKRKVLRTERGAMFELRSVPAKDCSAKDLRARYEPLYHALRFLGFQVAIGTEEQEGLLGEHVVTDEAAYYASLAVILLASQVSKDQKRFAFAHNLLHNAPSVTLMALSNNQEHALNQDKMLWLVKALYRSDIVIARCHGYEKEPFDIAGGEVTMKGLLEDATFFADKEKGIPHYCVEPEERGEFWQNLSKHKAAKPVAQALDAMLTAPREGGFDVAAERFLRNLTVKIASEEQSQMAGFVKRATAILRRYYELRWEDIGEFIKAKNSLLSAIFIFTRYQNLREVINEHKG
jgi:hypothetical protein